MEITAQFLAAAATGDVDALMTMLAPDVVWTADSDGKVSAARRPDRRRRARSPGSSSGLIRLGRTRRPGRTGDLQQRARRWCSTSATTSRASSRVEIIDGKITNFYAMRNPEKLAAVTVPREISR